MRIGQKAIKEKPRTVCHEMKNAGKMMELMIYANNFFTFFSSYLELKRNSSIDILYIDILRSGRATYFGRLDQIGPKDVIYHY